MQRIHKIVAEDIATKTRGEVSCINTGNNFFEVVRNARKAWPHCQLYYWFEKSKHFSLLISTEEI